MALQEYQRKRRFDSTPEPRGNRASSATRQARSFVVQLHHARVRHYDFRLEVDGVLHSWSVPRGPSLRPGEKRLAVEVEDHPLSYADFQGLIPEGNYGAGHVAIFDAGRWVPESDPAAAIAAGKLEFELLGEKLKGRWTLVRTAKQASKPQWILLKRSDAHAADLEADDLIGDLPAPPRNAPGASTAHGLRILARKGSEASVPASRLKELRERARSLAKGKRFDHGEFVPPMLTVASDSPPPGEHWIHEWKWDGYRLLARTGATPQLWSRNGLAWSDRVPELIRALGGLGVEATVDGELIAVNARGYSDFNALQLALKSGETGQLRLTVFDVLAVEGHDVRDVPLSERKALLETLLEGADPRLFYSGHVDGHGDAVFAAARAQSMEGIISKRADSPYVSGRSDRWLKIKAVETREFIVVGYTPPKGARKGVGALLLAEPKGSRRVYVGRVGSGLTDRMLLDLHRRLTGLHTEDAQVVLPEHVPLPRGRIQWVKPELVVEVVFRGWGKEGLLRQASFHRLREDKPADDAESLVQPAPLPQLSSPDKIVYPDPGYTKQQVFDYYHRVADRLLEDIGGRLLSIVRCPDGIGGPHFFQKHAGPGFGEAIKRHTIRENDGESATYFYVDDLAGLLNLAQMNAIELHPWGSKVEHLEQPDRIVFDLDPDPSIGWNDVKKAAREVRDRLREVGLESWPRLTGGKGVHVVVPIAPYADWAQVRSFAEAFADAMATQAPERYVATMSKAKRKGRIFVDWLRNGRGATAIATWSLRARRGAPAAMALTWEELARIRRPDRFSLKDAATREWPPLVRELIARAPRLPV